MPNLKTMIKTMEKLKIPPKIMNKIELAAETDNNEPYRISATIAVIDKMDELLTKDQRLAIMEREGCCKGGKRDKDCKTFGKEYADKPLEEKLKFISGIEYMMSPVLNNDGTITVTWGGYENGGVACSCAAIKKLKQPFSVSSTYCGCCAGHFLYHYQNALNVKLRLKEINSSPLNTNGEKPCSVTFEIVD